MVDAHCIEAEGRETVGQLFRLFPVRQLGVADEVRAVKADRRFRPVAEDEPAVRTGDHGAVLAGRGVEPCRKIQRTAFFDVPVVGERLPLLPRSRDVGGTHDRAERRPERPGFTAAEPKGDFRLADFRAGVRHKAETHSIGGPVPLAPVLNAQEEIPLEQDFAVAGRQPQPLQLSGDDLFAVELFGKADQLAVRLESGSAVLRNQQGALQAEEADCGRTVEFRLAGEFAAGIILSYVAD